MEYDVLRNEELPNYCAKDGYRFQLNDIRCPVCQKERLLVKKLIPERKWKKVLYERQPFEDNYLDSTFLESLISTEQSHDLKYQNLLPKSLEVSLAVSQVCAFMILLEARVSQKIQTPLLLGITTLSSLIGAFLYIVINPKILKLHSILSNLKSACIIVGLIFLLSPVLKTFNSNYASDTIYAMSFGLVLFHLITKDYGFIFEKSTNDINIDNSTLAIFFLSVLLGSRCDNSTQVFVMWMINLMLFVFLKYLLKAIRSYSTKAYSCIVVFVIIGLALPITEISKIVLIVYVAGNLFITLICPFWLIWLYQYKNVIQGPWDLPDIKQHDD